MFNVLSAEQFNQKQLFEILKLAQEMEEILKKGGSKMADGKILATIFYEPSTRTRLSFETSMLRLGGSVISETDVHFSSAFKGEVLADTIRIVSGYTDVIAMRTKNKGDANLASKYSSVPIINGGDGSGEHPTQSLLDLFTISKHFRLNDEKIKVAFVGDLKYGRTVHSLSTMLRNFDNVEITFVAPEVVQMPEKYMEKEDKVLLDLNEDVLKNSDVIYDTRIQKERFDDMNDYEVVKNAFVFNPEKVAKMQDNAILLHPLPRINEITMEVDSMRQAQYFEQAQNGVPVRMALIARALGVV